MRRSGYLKGAAVRKASDKLEETRETLERMEDRLSNTRESFLEALEEIGSLKESIKSYEDGIRNQCLEMNLALSLLMVQREVLEREHNSDNDRSDYLAQLHLSKGNELAIKALTSGGDGVLDDLMHEYNIYKTTATGGHKQ